MEDLLIDLFGSFGRIIVFLHVVSGALLIGSMFTIKFIIKPLLEAEMEDEVIRYGKGIKILTRYIYFVLAIMLLIISASLTMSVGLGFEYASPTLFSLVHVKEALWVFIAFNFVYAYIKLRNAKKLFKTREFFEVKENLGLIFNFLIPMNLILSLIAVYIGIIIRGF